MEHWEGLQLRRGPVKLTYRQIVALAGDAYRAFADSLEEDPGKAEVWAKVISHDERAASGALSLKIDPVARITDSFDERFGPIADAIICPSGP